MFASNMGFPGGARCLSEPLTSKERGGNEYQKPLKPLRDLPTLQTEPSPTLWTVLNFLFCFDQMAENLNLLGVNKKRYFVEVIKGPTRSVIQVLGIPTTEYEVLKKSVIMSTCGPDWVAEAEGQWRKLYQGNNSIELHLETVNIYCQSLSLDPNLNDFQITFRMSLRKEFQIALENNFGYIENSGITWATLTNWLCSVKRTNTFKMVEAYLKSNRQQQQQAPKPLCMYCGKHGHWEANCLTKRKQGQTKTPEKTQQSGNTAKLTGKPEESGSEKKGKKTFPPCSYCGKSGHSKKNCFKKKKDKREAEVNLVETTAGPL